MPRISRAIAAGVPHHLTQRGNRGQVDWSPTRCRSRPDEIGATLPGMDRPAWLADEPDADLDALRGCTARREPRGRTTSGLPCGAPAFVTDLEIRLARPLMPRPRGRPRQLAAKKESGSG